MRVLHVSGARSWGGNEQQLYYLVEGLNKEDVEQGIFCYSKNPLLEVFAKDEISVFDIDYVKSHKYKYWLQFKKVVREYNPEIIHIHTGNSLTGYVLADLFFSLKPKLVFSKKGISRKMSFLSAYKYNYKKICKFICVSERVKDSLNDVLSDSNKEKIEIVWDGVSKNNVENIVLKSNYTLPEKSFVIGNIANHTQSKDLHTFIKTANYLVNHKGYKNFYFFQIGCFTGLTEELKELIKDYQLENNLFMLGFQENASTYFSSFDVFFMSSKKEGGPTSVLEAMLYKTPVVSTNVGVIPKAINNSENGFYGTIGAHEELAAYIETLYENPNLRQDFAEKSYHICKENFSVDSLTKKTLDIYKSIL